jgi:hypothetical protein
MKLFEKKPLVEASFWQRISGSKNSLNAFIEFNNLLAERGILGVTKEHVLSICEKYKIEDWKKEFNEELRNCFVLAIGFFLSDSEISSSEVDELEHLAALLCITNEEKEKIYTSSGLKVFDELYAKFIEDELLSDEEKAILAKLKEAFALKSETLSTLVEKRITDFANKLIKEMIEDKRIAPGELEEFFSKCSKLGVNYSFQEESQKILDDYKENWNLENAPLVPIEVGINLKKGEVCYYKKNVTWHELRTVTHGFSYGGPAMNFKIVKGISFRAGRMAVQRITTDEMKELDMGVLYVTNQRLIFDGQVRNNTLTYKSILAIQPYEDGIKVEKERGKSPVFQMLVPDEKLTIILGRIFSEMKG